MLANGDYWRSLTTTDVQNGRTRFDPLVIFQGSVFRQMRSEWQRPIAFVDKDAQRSAVHVVILTIAHGPEKCGKSRQAEAERNRDKYEQPSHLAAFRKRSAFPTTIIDDPDIARAATSGVTCPMIASGTAIAL